MNGPSSYPAVSILSSKSCGSSYLSSSRLAKNISNALVPGRLDEKNKVPFFEIEWAYSKPFMIVESKGIGSPHPFFLFSTIQIHISWFFGYPFGNGLRELK